MQLKVNEKVLSIPPHLSTTWSQIAALRMKGALLSITMNDGETINIGHLTSEQIDEIFNFHALYLEQQDLPPKISTALGPNNTDMDPFKDADILSFSVGMKDGMSSGMFHNPDQAMGPDIPEDVLSKISEIVKAIGAFDEFNLPIAQPHCNCIHCQIAKKISGHEPGSEQYAKEETVSDEELQFQEWQIEQMGDQLYKVINCLDEQETYNVFLGEPVGCTCGKVGCEHILVVLKS